MAEARLDQPRGARRTGPRYDAEAFGRFAETIARLIGTARFLVLQTIVVVVWIVWNFAAPPELRFDQYPFIFLTLVLSLQAAYAAPLILLAQNRQDDRDRVNLEEDRQRAGRTGADIEYLARELAAVRIALGEAATRDFIRSELEHHLSELDQRLDLVGKDGAREPTTA
jgi:uncharacterized membrane protein